MEYKMKLKINSEVIERKVMTVCIGSGPGYGQTPNAVPYNGMLDVSVVYHPEMVQLIGIAQSSLTVVANYVKDGVESSVTYTAEVEDSNAFGVCYWVSPSDVQTHIPSGARLVGYETRYGYSVCKYEVEDGNYAQKSQFLYLNRWGVYESLWCIGSEKWNINRSAEIGLSGGELTALDIDVDDTYEVSTGYVNDSVLEQLRDLAESPLVWLLDNSTFKKVAIDDVKMERVLPSNEARTATITYRYANRNM
jgi:hypothetical protein